MQARQTLTPGRKCTKSSSKGTANNWFQVCYHSDEQCRKRCATVEIIIEKSGWSQPERPEFVRLRAKFQETELKRRVKKAGGKWISENESGKFTITRRRHLISRSEL
jgi:hypothetical protein